MYHRHYLRVNFKHLEDGIPCKTTEICQVEKCAKWSGSSSPGWFTRGTWTNQMCREHNKCLLIWNCQWHLITTLPPTLTKWIKQAWVRQTGSKNSILACNTNPTRCKGTGQSNNHTHRSRSVLLTITAAPSPAVDDDLSSEEDLWEGSIAEDWEPVTKSRGGAHCPARATVYRDKEKGSESVWILWMKRICYLIGLSTKRVKCIERQVTKKLSSP